MAGIDSAPPHASRSHVVTITLLLLLIAAYLAVCGLFYFKQDQMVFPAPTEYAKATPKDKGIDFEDLHIPVNGSEQIHAWWIPAASSSEKVLLVFHGNGYVLEQGIAGNYPDDIEFVPFYRLGTNLLLIDYRGYGSSSPGPANENRVYEDARAAFTYLTVQRKIPGKDVILVGRSIGTGPATEMAKEHPEAGGLVLLSPFTSTTDIARTLRFLRLLPLTFLSHNKFDNFSKIDSVHIPILMVVGTDDTLTPPAMAQTLFEKANQPKRLYLVPGADHNGLIRVGGQKLLDEITVFLQTIH